MFIVICFKWIYIPLGADAIFCIHKDPDQFGSKRNDDETSYICSLSD